MFITKSKYVKEQLKLSGTQFKALTGANKSVYLKKK